MSVAAIPAGMHDWRAGMLLLADGRGAPRDGQPSVVLGDQSFHRPVVAGMSRYGRRRLVIGALVDQPPQPPVRSGINNGFRVIPKRWMVERTNAWMASCRRLNREHERTTYSHEAFVWLASIRLLLRRLTRPQRRK